MAQPSQFAMIRSWIGASKQWLSHFLDRAPSERSIIAIVVMGSVVRQRVHRRSDFDLLVVYQERRPAIKAPLEVDIRFVSVDGIDKQISEGQEIVCWALQFGCALYDPKLFWHRMGRLWAGRVPLPSAAEARARGIKNLARAVEMLEFGDESAADDLVLSALTQFVRERLISGGVFPASRPELPNQLRTLCKNDPLARLLDEAMYGDCDPAELVFELNNLQAEVNVRP